MTSAQLIAWAQRHERRSRRAWSSPLIVALGIGAAIAAWVAWRASSDPVAASHVWLAATLVAFGVAFMRVPFHLYWRADAALLAQLPIEGGPLFDAALWRCLRAAAATTIAAAVGALPLAQLSTELFARHLAFAGTLGLTAGLFMPAATTWAAAIVAADQSAGLAALRAAAGIDRERTARSTTQAPTPSTAMLGALPGFASTVVIVVVLLASPWLVGRPPSFPAEIVLGSLVGVSVVSVLAARVLAARVMGAILRDVSALDRQRLATLELRPPTAIERAVARMIGDAALPYAKDARLMRRRYPMVFALGGLTFVVLVIVGVAGPDDPTSWLTATLGAATVYGVSVAGRLHRAPIELMRLSHSLPIADAARHRAKRAWLAAWWCVFVVAPGAFAAARQAEPWLGLTMVGAGSLLVLGSERLFGANGRRA